MRNTAVMLDTARWISALLVASSHVRNFLFVDWGDATHHGPFWAALYWLTGFGRMSVMVFFVLSGYLVGGRAAAAIASRTFRMQDYAINRLARLYPPLVAALALTAVLDLVGLNFFNHYGYYDFPNSYRVAGETPAVSDALTPADATLNLMFLQTIAGPTFGSNTPLWSLANEFWYYVTVPVVLLLFSMSRRRPSFLIIGLAVMGVAAVWLPSELVILSLTWLAGAAAYRLARARHVILQWSTLALFAIVAAVLRTSHLFQTVPVVADLIVGGLFALVLLVHGRPATNDSSSPGISARLAGFSYSLYLTHVPLLFLLAAATLQIVGSPVRLQPDLRALSLFAAYLALAIGMAYGLSRITEARTGAIRRWIHARVGARSQR